MSEEKNTQNQESETKAEKFIRLGEYRVNKIMEAIKRLEHLSNRGTYEYTTDQVEAMFSILETRLSEVKAGFAEKKKGTVNFTFSNQTEEGGI